MIREKKLLEEQEERQKHVDAIYADFEKKYPKPAAKEVEDIDYYEMEAQLAIQRVNQKKEDGLEYLNKMQMYDQYVKESFAPKVSKKKREELLHAQSERKCSFARYNSHLPMEAMALSDVKVPISPKYYKAK